jgi:hypothetical protein
MKLEEGMKTVRFSFIDADGKDVLPTLEQSAQFRTPPNSPTATQQFCLNIPQLRVPHFGEYSISLAIDGREEKSIPLFVRQMPQRPPASLPPPQPN